MNTQPYDIKTVKRELMIHAKALGIPTGAAETFVEQAVVSATKALKTRKIITERDLRRALVKELKKYNKDFAYVYENYDKII